MKTKKQGNPSGSAHNKHNTSLTSLLYVFWQQQLSHYTDIILYKPVKIQIIITTSYVFGDFSFSSSKINGIFGVFINTLIVPVIFYL